MIAYHGSQTIKDRYLARVRAHRAADELVHGVGWNGHKGCSVGCTLNDYDHAAYESELGIPEALAHLEDVIFEYLPLAESMDWPERFLSAIEPGADLSLVAERFIHWLQGNDLDGVQPWASASRTPVYAAVCVAFLTTAYAATVCAARVKQANKLIELLSSAPIPA